MTRLIHDCGAARTGTTSVGLTLGQAPKETLKRLCALTGVPYKSMMKEANRESLFLFSSGGVHQRLRDQGGTGFSLGGKVGFAEYTMEFEEVTQPLQERIESSPCIRFIIQPFRDHDVFSVSQEQMDYRPLALRSPMPLWYYKLRGYRALRRVVPERY